MRLQWGSAFVLVGMSGSAIVAIAPLFREPPREQGAAFYRKLLEHNAYMGGMASFAIQPDGWVILHAGRALKGMDSNEFATMVAGVGRFADQFDDTADRGVLREPARSDEPGTAPERAGYGLAAPAEDRLRAANRPLRGIRIAIVRRAAGPADRADIEVDGSCIAERAARRGHVRLTVVE